MLIKLSVLNNMGSYGVQMLFPVCLHQYFFDEFDADGLIKFCYKQKKKDSKGQVKSNRGGWHSRFFNLKDDNIISTHLKRGLSKSIFTSGVFVFLLFLVILFIYLIIIYYYILEMLLQSLTLP